MSKTIEFGAFLSGRPSWDRLRTAQGIARNLGVTLSSDGGRFAGQGSQGDPVKVVVTVPDNAPISQQAVARGRDALDALLSPSERLTDYALVKQNGVLVSVISTLTGEVKAVQQTAQAARPAAQAPAPAPQRRWSPFRRNA